jgi:Polysaccharide deacetylase
LGSTPSGIPRSSGKLAAGHAIGSHTWSHRDLSKMSYDQAKTEIEKKLKKRGKGIILMHDFQRTTADGLATLLDQLKLNPGGSIQTLPGYDETFSKIRSYRQWTLD